MAQATGASDAPPTRYFCHQCDTDIIPLPNFLCPRCHTGFIEEVTADSDRWFQGRGSEYEPAPRPLLHDILESIYGAIPAGGGAPPTGQSRIGRQAPTRSAPPNQSADISAQALEGIFQQILSSVAGVPPGVPVATGFTGGRTPAGGPQATMHGQVNFEFPFFQMINLHGNPGDYAWGQGGLDAVISQLLNQLDSSGPAPMPKEDIDRIPTTQITKDDVERNMQCSVCMDDYKLGEEVRKLDCSHVFHNDCIIPWLQMHATCPICRTNLSKSDTGNDGDSSRRRPAPDGPGPSDQGNAPNGRTLRNYDDLMDYD